MFLLDWNIIESASGAGKSFMVYDYLLVVGPGRSGSDFLYENLKNHPELAFPEIKEGYYYRSPRNFDKTLRGLQGKTLVDIANLAYKDPSLTKGLEQLAAKGCRTLIVVLLRNHYDRALSMMRFRKSRGEVSALFGRRRLEDAVIQDRLKPSDLLGIYRCGVDVLTVSFPTLTQDTGAVLDTLSTICGVSHFNYAAHGVVNESVRTRHILLSVFGKSVAVALRRLGLTRILQKLKDNQSVRDLFFVPLSRDARGMSISQANMNILQDSYLKCRSIIHCVSDEIGEGIYFRRAGAAKDSGSTHAAGACD